MTALSNSIPSKIIQGKHQNTSSKALFDRGRRWAYKRIRGHWRPEGQQSWKKAVLSALKAINTTLESPVDTDDVEYIAGKIAAWTWNRFTPAAFREVQARRGRRSGEKRSEKSFERADLFLKLRADYPTESVAETAKRAGISRAAAFRVLSSSKAFET